MSRAFDGTIVPNTLPRLPCGGIPVFDEESGCAYRCDACFAVIGSVSQPKRCIDMNTARDDAQPLQREIR